MKPIMQFSPLTFVLVALGDHVDDSFQEFLSTKSWDNKIAPGRTKLHILTNLQCNTHIGNKNIRHGSRKK